MPSKLHMTAPYSFRRSSAIPPILILYKVDIDNRDIEQMTGFKATRPLRTILDLLEEDKTSRHIIKQALEQALQRGLITRMAINRLSNNKPVLATPSLAIRSMAGARNFQRKKHPTNT